MSLQSFQKAYQKISQLNQFLISMTYGLFTRTAVKIELGHAAIPQLLQSSTKFVLSNMLYFNSTNGLGFSPDMQIRRKLHHCRF